MPPTAQMYIMPEQAHAHYSEDIKRIIQLVSDVEKAQWNKNADDFTSLFTENAVWVTAHGKLLTGWTAIDTFTRQVLPGSDSFAKYEIINITFIRPDVAITNVRQYAVTEEGSRIENEQEGRPTYVLVKNDDTWKIASGQNTKKVES